MKIMYCITSSSWGGAQLHVLELCEDQIRRGNDVYFVVGNKGLLLDKVKQIKGVKTYVIPNLHREVSPVNDFKAIFKLRRLIKKIQPDILHLHSSKAGTIGRLASIGLNCKVVFTVHGWAFTDGNGTGFSKMIYRLVEKVNEPLTDMYFCVSNFDKRIGYRDGVLKQEDKVAVIHNGVPQRIMANRDKITLPIKIIMVARFSPQKNQEMLIKALAKVDKKKFELIFVGDGETLEYKKKLVKKLGLQDQTVFYGFKQDVLKYLEESDLYVLTTHYEGLPISIIEAMSCSLPIIASNVGGNNELVKNDFNGYLVSESNELVERLNYLLDNPEVLTKMGENSFKLFNSEFKLSKCLSSVNYRYEQIIK